jgi:hypothetical protein
MGLPDEDFVKHPSFIWMPLEIGQWMITVAFDNCGEIIREYPRCIHWLWSRCIHFDTGNDALRDPMSIHAARGEPIYAAFLASRVKLFCILVELTLFCCNPQDHGSAQRQRAVDAFARFGGDLT